MIRLTLTNDRERLQIEHATGPVELGRGPAREGTSRCVVQDPFVSKDHARLEELPERRLRIENLSQKHSVLAPGGPIRPGESRELLLPVKFVIGDTTAEIQTADEEGIDPAHLQSVAAPVAVRSISDRTLDLTRLGDTPSAETLVQWFETVVTIQRTPA